jgi:pilus assembly protein CpaB
MRLVFGLVLMFGLALAGFAVWMVQGYVSTAQSEVARERADRLKMGEVVEVFVVKKNLAYGDPLTKDSVALVYFPKKSLPENAFTTEEALFPGDYAKPRYVLRPMEKLEVILPVKVTEPGQDAGLTARLTKGFRAFAIKVDVSSGVSGFVQPGDAVDIYWTGQANRNQGDVTQLIESTIQVIAIDQETNSDRGLSGTVARTVTVEATPEQVARLAQAQATGRLALSLVGRNDETVAGGIEVDSAALLGISAEAPVEVQQDRICTVRTRRGSEVLEIPIPCTN